MDYFIKMGVPCYGNQDVCDNHKGCNVLPKVLKVDGFTIQNFELVHNVPNNAFVIDTDDGVRILYCTDTEYIPYKVKNVHYAIIECNYDFDYMIDNLMEGKYSMSHHENHHSLDKCIEYLKLIYSNKLQGVVLWHMSNANIDAEKALQKVQDELAFPYVYIADKGVVIDVSKDPF